MATQDEINQKRVQAQMEKEQRIRNTEFTQLNREDALLRMSYMQKDLTQANKTIHEMKVENKAFSGQFTELKTKTELLYDFATKSTATACETREAMDAELEKRLETTTGFRKLKPEEPVTHYDRLTVNFTGFMDDKPQPSMSGRNTTFELNYQTYIVDLEAGFIGMKPGEFKVHQATFPEGYHAPELSGKSFRFDLELIGAYRNVKIETMMVERDKSERTAILEQMDQMQMRPSNFADMTTDQLRTDLAELKKEFAHKQKTADGVIHSGQPPAVGEMDVLPEAVH